MLLFLILLLPFIEIYLLLNLTRIIGGVNVLWFIIGSGILGIWLMKRQGSSMLQKLNQSVAQRQVPSEALSNGFFTFLGGLFLLVPGVLTDVIGVSLIFPPTRFLWKSYFTARVNRGISSGRIHVYKTYQSSRYSGASQEDEPRPTLENESQVIDIEAQSSVTVEKKEEP